MGRSQQGNNNAYAQDNAISWVDWAAKDEALLEEVAQMAAWRAEHVDWFASFPSAGEWRDLQGNAMTAEAWENPATQGFSHVSADPSRPYAFTLDRSRRSVTCSRTDSAAP